MTAFGPQSPNYATTRPANAPVMSGTTDTWMVDCSAAGATDGTILTADFFNTIIANLREAVRGAGIALDGTNDLMVYQAIAAECRKHINLLTSNEGITKTGDNFALNIGKGTQPMLTNASAQPALDKLQAYDNSAGAVSEITIYQAVKAVLDQNPNITFNDATGKATFASPKHTAASIPPAISQINDTWYDTDNDRHYVRTNDGSNDLWLEITG